MIGKTLADYEITTKIGRGGMGEVYQAKNLKLGRSVAIKVLPEGFAKDADRAAGRSKAWALELPSKEIFKLRVQIPRRGKNHEVRY